MKEGGWRGEGRRWSCVNEEEIFWSPCKGLGFPQKEQGRRSLLTISRERNLKEAEEDFLGAEADCSSQWPALMRWA